MSENDRGAPEHISHTQISMATKCGMMYYFRYPQGKKIPPGVAQTQGRTAHDVRDTFLHHKMETGANMPLEQLESGASDGIDNAFAGEIILEADWADRGISAVKDAVKDQSIALARLDHEVFLQTIEPLEVEKMMLVKSGLLPKPLMFRVDLVEKDGTIRDMKTAGKSPSKGDADTDLQLTGYALGRRLATGTIEKAVRKDYLVKTKKPKAVFQVSTRTEDDIQVLLNRMTRIVEMIDKEIWIPAPADSWWCSEKWCGYWGMCPYAVGRPRPTT